MLTSHVRRRARGAAVLTASALLFPAAAAQAADAPLRTIGITPTGERTANFAPVAISPDGREVIQREYRRAYVRNVAAGTTTQLANDIGDVSASSDTKLVAVVTSEPLVSADTDVRDDLYVINRAAGNAATLVSGPSLGLELDDVQRNALVDDVLISGNGNLVTFTVSRAIAEAGGAINWRYERWRYDRATGTSTKTATELRVRVQRLDDAGKVEITDTQVKVDGRAWPIPSTGGNFPEAWSSPDGTAVAFRDGFSPSKFAVLNTTTGAVRNVTAPSWITPNLLDVYAPTNAGGDFLVIGTTLTRPAGERYAVGRLQVSNAAVTQVGPDVQITAGAQRTVSSNLAFAATNLHLAQLGTAPLPGTEPSLPGVTVKAWDYLDFGDATCTRAPFGGNTWTRPYVYAKKGAQGTDLRTPTKAVVKATMINGTVANYFTISAGASRELNTGRVGGYTLDATVSFSDGSTVTGSKVVPQHELPYCNPFYWF